MEAEEEGGGDIDHYMQVLGDCICIAMEFGNIASGFGLKPTC